MSNHSSVTEFCLLRFLRVSRTTPRSFCCVLSLLLSDDNWQHGHHCDVCVDKRLQSPMYFFLSHLSALEIMITSLIVPRALRVDAPWDADSISGCMCTQLFLYIALGTTEFALVEAMAVDRYVAVCNPLRYNTIMNSCTCISVVIGSWVFGFFSEVWPVYATFQFIFCKSNVLDHFFCDRGQLLKLSCDDTVFTRVCSVFNISLSLVLWPQQLSPTPTSSPPSSRAPPPLAAGKTFSTCASHFTACCHRLWQPLIPVCETQAKAQAAEHNKIVSLLICVLTPLLNPFIFTLRNDKSQTGPSRWSETWLSTPQGLTLLWFLLLVEQPAL